MGRATGRARLLVRSFAFRLGAAFAFVAVAASALTAGLVSAAFGSPFNRYLDQQRSAQLHEIASIIEGAYRGDGKWNVAALPTVGSLLGTGTLRLEDPYGNTVWRWPVPTFDGRSPAGSGRRNGGGGNRSGSGGEQHTGSPSPGHDGWDHGSWDQGGSWDGGSSGSGGTWSGSGWAIGTAHPAAAPGGQLVLVSATLASTSSLEATQRIPIVVDGRTVGYALVRLQKPSQQPQAVAFRSDLVRRLLLGGIVAALLSLALGMVFAFRATAPVRRVQGAAQAISAGDRSVPMSLDRSDEFGDVGRALKSMADSVDEQERLRQSFAAQVAHELRTPLTILRSQVEGMRVGVIEPTPETIVSLDEELARMTRLVADLQILGSADAAGFSLERGTVDVGDVVDETVREFGGLFEGSEVRLETRLEHVTAWVDRVRIGQIVSNLLSNALKFTPPRGQVRVELRREDRWAVLRVSDSGPGIPPDELSHVFDRFFRGRASRPSGSGIGLAVVRELVRAHAGEVEVASDPASGATFTVRIPLQPTPSGPELRSGLERRLSAVRS